MSKKLLVPVAVILACAVILAAAGAGLAGTAAANAEKELGEMISYLLPGGGEFEEIEYKGTDSKITNVYKGEGGYVLAMTANGYVDEIKLLVAVDNVGVVKGYTVRDIHDTYGLGLGVQDDLFFLVGLMNSKGDLAVNSNIDAVTGATISSSAVVACVNAASKYVQESGAAGGPLTGTANGFGGPITVSVTMDGDKITAVEIVSNSETPEIAGTALEQIPAAIVAANSPDVDIVSGATYTSNGIINAVKNALDSAGGGSGALTGTADGFIGPITVAVTMDGAMVGYTYNVTPTKSTVRTIIDSEASIAALIQSSRDQGTVRGTLGVDGTPLCRMYYLPEDNLPRPGDVVVTSGVGDLNDGRSFPKGIPIGTVRESTRGMESNKQFVVVEPQADFQHIEYVIVLRYQPAAQAVEERASTDEGISFTPLDSPVPVPTVQIGSDFYQLAPTPTPSPTPGPTVTVGEDGQEVLVTPAPARPTSDPGESYEYQVPDAAATDMSYGFTLPPTATPSPTPPPLDLSVEED